MQDTGQATVTTTPQSATRTTSGEISSAAASNPASDRLDPAVILAPSPFAAVLRRFLGNSTFIFAGSIFGLIVLMALFAPIIAPYDPYAQDLSKRIIPPVWYDGGSWAHILGTDGMGRDYLSRLMYGAQISLLIGISAAFISGIIGSLLGGWFVARAKGGLISVLMVLCLCLNVPNLTFLYLGFATPSHTEMSSLSLIGGGE